MKRGLLIDGPTFFPGIAATCSFPANYVHKCIRQFALHVRKLDTAISCYSCKVCSNSTLLVVTIYIYYIIYIILCCNTISNTIYKTKWLRSWGSSLRRFWATELACYASSSRTCSWTQVCIGPDIFTSLPYIMSQAAVWVYSRYDALRKYGHSKHSKIQKLDNLPPIKGTEWNKLYVFVIYSFFFRGTFKALGI